MKETEPSQILTAALQCEGLAVMLDIRAGRASEADHQSGQYGDWCHDSEVLRLAALILRRENASRP